jgi:hypothetical protein
MRRLAWIVMLCLACLNNGSAQEAKPAVFAGNGYLTKDQLAKFTYGPVINGLALGLHLPNTRVSTNEPVWAYFVVKNTQPKLRELDMRFDAVIGSPHALVNSCGFTIRTFDNKRQIAEAKIRNGLWQCGQPLVYVPGQDYYVAALDLGDFADLRPGNYEVSWHYSLRDISSNPVRFTVLAGPERRRDAKKPAPWTLWELDLSAAQAGIEKKKKSPDGEGRSNMRRFPQGELSAALGCGVGGRYITHLDWLPDRDDLITVSADWQLGKEFDRVTLRLAPRKNGQTVTLHDLHVYLLAQGPESLSPSEEEGKRIAWEKALTVKNSHSIEFRLPIAWRTLRRITQALALLLRGHAHCHGIDIEEVRDELVRVLRLHTVRGQGVCGKIGEIESDNCFGTAVNGGGEHMAVIRVGKEQTGDEAFIPLHEAVGHRLVHQVSGPFQSVTRQLRTILEQASHPLLVDHRRPPRPVEARQRNPQQ